MVNAILHHLRAGSAWRLLPHDLPPWQAVCTRFQVWRLDGTRQRVYARVREDARLDAGAPPQPPTGRIDRQTVMTTHRGGDRTSDGGNKVLGRKRFIVVDSRGLIGAPWVCPADHQDRDGGRWLLGRVAGLLPRLAEVIADSGFSRTFVDWVLRRCGRKVTTTHNTPRGSASTPGGGWSSGRSPGT